MKHPLLAVAATALGLALAGRADAETINCTNITSVPTTLTTQGVYCLKQDLATAVASGAAITVGTNNVTIDCNGYKLGGLAAGAGTLAIGIASQGRHNLTVRNCSVRGFYEGIRLGGGSGHVVEDSRFDGNTRTAIYLVGDGGIVRRNTILDTGGNLIHSAIAGIFAIYNVDVIDNTVTNVTAANGSNDGALGIYTADNTLGSIAGNRVRGLFPNGSGTAVGIYIASSGSRVSLRDNTLGNTGTGVALRCADGLGVAAGNHLLGFTTAIQNCTNGGGNVSN